MASLVLPDLQRRLDAAFSAALQGCATSTPIPGDPRFGADYQVGDALRFGRRAREVAQEAVQRFDPGEPIGAVSASGPGFVGVRLDDAWVAKTVERIAVQEGLGLPAVEHPRRIVVDFSSPNVAKRMHIGHLRSTIIGDALLRTHRRLGHHVVGDNHVGDWGTQFGVIIRAWRQRHGDRTDVAVDIAGLEELYRCGSAAAKADPESLQAARAEVVRLQGGERLQRQLWERFVAISRMEAERVYVRLGVGFDLWLGESAYAEALPGVVRRLRCAGIATDSEGATVVRFPPGSALVDSPWIVQKADGGYLYSTTDVATVLSRADSLRAEQIVYVVDVRQALHFQQLFETARMLGVGARLDHVGFGMMLGDDGRPFRTRDGGTVSLEALLDEAVDRALPLARAHAGDRPDDEVRAVAEAVGISAVKFADLSQDLATDYRFCWDAMLSFDGYTGPYVQYAAVRASSIAARASADGGAVSIAHPLERQLAVHLVRYGDVLDRVEATLRPHHLCRYLFELASLFARFYRECPVIGAGDPALVASRLTLCRAVERTLVDGMGCLNLRPVGWM